MNANEIEKSHQALLDLMVRGIAMDNCEGRFKLNHARICRDDARALYAFLMEGECDPTDPAWINRIETVAEIRERATAVLHAAGEIDAEPTTAEQPQ